jgi:hypothetical protein
VELQTVEISLNAQARKLQEGLETIRSDHLREYDLTHLKVQATRKETHAEIEATRHEFQLRLDAVEARTERGSGALMEGRCIPPEGLG